MSARATTTEPVALVTGASIGIGEQFARLLAERGNDLVLVARDAGRLEALAKELEAKHGNHCEVLAADLTDRPSNAASSNARVADVDVLVNNAGFGSFGNCFELDVDTEDRADPAERRRARAAHARRGRAAWSRAAAAGSSNVASLAGFQPDAERTRPTPRRRRSCSSFTEAVHEELKGTGCRGRRCSRPASRTPSSRRAPTFDPKSVPGFLWQEAEPVARAGLDGLAKNHAVIVPGRDEQGRGRASRASRRSRVTPPRRRTSR